MTRSTAWTLVASIALVATGCRSRCGCPPCETPTASSEPIPHAAPVQAEVFVDMSVLALKPDELSGIEGYSPARGSVQDLSGPDADTLLSRFASKVVQAPKFLVLAGHEASVSIGDWANENSATGTGFHAAVHVRETAAPRVEFDHITVRWRETASEAERTIQVSDVGVDDGGRLLVIGQAAAGRQLIGVLKVQRLPPGT